MFENKARERILKKTKWERIGKQSHSEEFYKSLSSLCTAQSRRNDGPDAGGETKNASMS
jgi:hypothetical protein